MMDHLTRQCWNKNKTMLLKVNDKKDKEVNDILTWQKVRKVSGRERERDRYHLKN